MKIHNLAAVALLGAALAAPAFAQNTTGTATTMSPAAGNNTPSARNSALTDNGQVRASKVIGSSVYNDQDQKVGTVDDIVLGANNAPSEAVLSVGGFLGMGAKLVEVPYSKLQFGNTNVNSDNRVILPGATKDMLTNMAGYHYSKNG